MTTKRETKSTSSEAVEHDDRLSYDWHKFQEPQEPVEGSGSGEDDKAEKLPEGQCETCGQGPDALQHMVDEAGNPTREARLRTESYPSGSGGMPAS